MGNQNDGLHNPQIRNTNTNSYYQNQNANAYSQNYQNNINKALSNPTLNHQNSLNQIPKNQQSPQKQNLQNQFEIINPPQKQIQNSNLIRSSTFNNKPIYKYHLNTKSLNDCFQNYSINNDYLNKNRFNDAIESLFRFPIPEMHYTYLSEKIFYLIDDSGDGKIQKDEFIQGFSNVLKDKNFRLNLSMVCMMNTNDKNRNYLDISEIKEFFFRSFIYGFKHLLYQVNKEKNEFQKKNLPVVTIGQIELWSERFELQIHSYIDKDLRENGIDPYGRMDFETFKKWIIKDHTIHLNYGGKNSDIATSLVKLDDIGFDESNPYAKI
jgi:hypothetical protein